MKKGIPFGQLIAELRQLCQERRTGMVFVTTDGNQLAQMSLENGYIVYLFFKQQRGEDALRALRQSGAGALRFAPGTIPASRSELPPTEEILDYLQGANGELLADPIVEPTAPAPTGASGLSERDKSIILEELTELIGPMAVIVCKEKLQATRDLEATIGVLSSALPDATQARRFKKNVLQRLEI